MGSPKRPKPGPAALSHAELYAQLRELAEGLSITVREDSLEGSRGGLYTLKGQRTLIVNRDLPLDARADLLIEILRKEDLSNVFVKPALRGLLE